jgi:Tfp pilus assembly protein PilN
MATVLERRQALLQNLIQKEQTYQTLRPEVRALLQRQAKLEHRLNQLQELARARTLVIQVVHRLVEVLPDEIWLTRLELSKDLPAATAAQAGGTLDGTLEGYASSFQSLTRLMDQLKTSVGWTTVKPLATAVTMDPQTGKEAVAFTVQVQQPLKPVTSDQGG